ncbi:MAG: hypothetical protein U5R31_05650 [Acidimicrobiia bacterium]|nr:hypothetical protein [Acidimicrobiia bacterium]
MARTLKQPSWLTSSKAASVVEPLTDSDWQRTLDLVRTYDDLPLGVTDASLLALAERRRVDRIATLDHRHFSVVRPAHLEAFELVPRGG